MIEKYLQSFAFFVLLGLIIIIMALMAVPYIYGSADLKNYIEGNVIIPGKRIKINSDVDFGVFPKIAVNIKDADVIDRIGYKNKIADFNASMGFFDVFTGRMRIKYSGKYNAQDFKGKLIIDDYYAMQRRLPTNFKLRLDVPIILEATGKFQLKENEISLRDYNLFHKTTRISGDIILTRLSDTQFNLVNHISVLSDNLEDLRALYNFSESSDNYKVIEGSGRINFTFSAKGDSIFALKRNLTGQGSIRIKSARLNGYDLEEIAKNPFDIKFLPDGERYIAVDNINGVFTILNGVFKTDDFNIKSKKANLISSGSYDIADEKIDVAMNLNADLTTSKINLPLIIRGDIKAPRIIGNFAQARNENGAAPTAAEAAQIQQNIESLTTIVNQKISENQADNTANVAAPAQDPALLNEILPWRSNAESPVKARVLSAEEEDEVIGNWNSSPVQPTAQPPVQPLVQQPALTPYEQEQLNKARELQRQKLNESPVAPASAGEMATPPVPASTPADVTPYGSANPPQVPATGVYVTQPEPIDGNIQDVDGASSPDEPVSNASDDVTQSAPNDTDSDTKFPEVPQ